VKPKRTVGIGIAVAAALLTSACAAGQQAQTAYEKPTLDGVNADIGSIHIRGMVIDPPVSSAHYSSGDNTTVKVIFVNTGDKPDALVSINSPAISDWGTFKSLGVAEPVLNPATSQSTTAPASPTATPSTKPTKHRSSTSATASPGASGSTSETKTRTASPSPSPSTSAAPLPTPNRLVKIPPNSRVPFGTPETTAVLAFLSFSQDEWPGTTIPVTLRFAEAGSITIQVPIALSGPGPAQTVPEPSSSSIGP
jgi:copper(I)-binding protein